MARASLLAVVVLAASAAAQPIATRDLRRPHDPVIVRTDRLGALPDRRTAQYRVFAARDGRVAPIPFQFDPVDADRRIVFTDGADARFDDDDELVLMAADLGDRVDADALPTGSDAVVEIEARDRGGAHGWAYLVHFADTPPPPSPERYVRFAPERNVAESPWYSVHYAPPPSNHLDGLRVATRPGAAPTPLLDGTRMRIGPTFSLLLTTWSPIFTEKSFTVTTDGVRNGPVRAIRRVRQALDLGRFFPELPNGMVQTFYYPSAVVTPSTFDIPSLVVAALRDFRFEAIHDFGARADGLRYWDETNLAGLPLTAARSRLGVDVDHRWWVASGDTGTLLNALVIPRQWRDWGITRGTVMSGDAMAPPDVDARGVGYRLRDMTRLKKGGSYDMATALVVLPTPYTPGDEADALAMLDDPLEVGTRRVSPP
jgi:hypothetical protein